ncbi:MAG: hypothetical protein GWO20_03160 [Candidatus Korarchaeota archaeon]|nr:hypothetical protein [Candidatus Korarchaeota archaeon]NIU82485.1 hypothetical protein [Candidatus Thorarchaeota archaeon]NIW12971.1 hypothetical protein [Candidatus Thorarchaeota archaeon]NIW51124.1 hypothetical protein [Candidatus Korarchaeota archaeon]
MYASPIIGILVGFFFFNRFPAKIFLGNSGAYGIGAMIAALVIVTRKEFVTMIALLPMILNAFIILVSIRGVKTKEDLASPVNIKDGKIFPNRDEEAPLTLVGLRASVQPVRERDVIRYFNILFVLSFFFALVTGALIYFQKALPMLPL